jgi:DNA-binding transcriptional regulator GbsR (MarR family)
MVRAEKSRPAPSGVEAITPDEARVIESFGLYFERQGIPRIGGRILGLLLLSEEMLSLGRIAELLRVSPASVSTNMRHFLTTRLVEEVSIPGDRLRYFTISAQAWKQQLESMRGIMRSIQELCQEGLVAVRPGARAARERLVAAIDFHEFMQAQVELAMHAWDERGTRRGAERSPRPAEAPPKRARRGRKR